MRKRLRKRRTNPDHLTSTSVKVRTRKKISKLAIDTDWKNHEFLEIVIDIIDEIVNTKEDLADLKNNLNK